MEEFAPSSPSAMEIHNDGIGHKTVLVLGKDLQECKVIIEQEAANDRISRKTAF